MQNIVDIKNRIKSIKDTAQITKAMELISISKLRKATMKYQNNMRYYVKIQNTIKSILDGKGDIQHPYFANRDTQRTAFIVIASDEGMAGDYNHRVLNFALKKIREVKDECSVLIIGQMANEFFLRHGIISDIEFLYASQDPTLDDANRITADLINLYDEKLIDEIQVIYTRSVDGNNQAYMERLLPILREDFDMFDGGEGAELEFEPSPTAVLDILAYQFLVGIIYSALVQSSKCEHTERMRTMNNATNNAMDIIEGLELEYHRARQEQITTEIAEITSLKINS